MADSTSGQRASIGAGSEHCLAIGTRLADFEITGVLGEGGFGIVYLAFDHSLQRTVAIKEYMPAMLAARADDHSVTVRATRHQETFNVGLKSFINEARFLAQFDHPALVKVFRYWEQNRTAYTAMQYYHGRTIKDIVTSNAQLVTQQWCLAIMRQILGALELLCSMNIVHRDVSPDNIIVQDNGEAVLLDLGSARQIIGESTRGLTVILKPGYAPVEQYAGDASLEQGPYTDIYALAAVMYFAIVGEPPASSIARMVKDPLVPLRGRGLAGYSDGFCAALDAGLAVLAAQRPQSIEAFRSLLGIEAPLAQPARAGQGVTRIATIDQLPATFSAPVPAPVPVPVPASEMVAVAEVAAPGSPVAVRRGPWRALAAVALVCAVIGVGAYALLGDPGDTIRIAPSQQHGVPVLNSTAAPQPAQAAPPMAAQAGAGPAVAMERASASASVSASAAASVGASALAAAPPAVANKQSPSLADKAEWSAEDLTAQPPAPAPAPAELAKVHPAPVTTASYTLTLKPWGTVYVDGKQRGVSPPLKKLVLNVGRHSIKVVNPSFPEHVIEVTVAAGKGGVIDHDFSASTR